jgi:hypothetical protein
MQRSRRNHKRCRQLAGVRGIVREQADYLKRHIAVGTR